MDPKQKEDLRHVVLETLANRHPAAITVRQIRHRAAGELDFLLTDEAVEAALEMLRGLGAAEFEMDRLGNTKYWKATSNGVLIYERRD